jgi:4'-phosphopantetheinyl transferase EntD
MFDDALPVDVAVEWGDPRDPAPPLFPEELEFVERAVEKRRLEFTQGRQCARAALRRLGLPRQALLVGANREPLWPPGVTGSITHTDELCAAAVGWQSAYDGIGIDLEPAEPLEPAVAQRVATAREMTALEAMPALLAARLVFSAKESFYKCQFYRTRQWLGFGDVAIELEPSGIFWAELLIQAQPLQRGMRFAGSWRARDGFLFTAIHRSAEQPARSVTAEGH